MTTPRRGRSLTDAASSIAPTAENTRTASPSAMPSAAASSGWMTTSLRLPDGCRPGSSLSQEFIECRLRRFASWNGYPCGACGTGSASSSRARATNSRRRRVHLLVVGSQRVPEMPELARAQHQPCGWAIRSRHLILRPLTFRPVATTSRSIQCGLNSRPGLRVSRASARVALMKPFSPLAPNSGLPIAIARSTKIRHSSRAPAAVRRPPSVLHVRLVVHVAGERQQVVALQPVRGGQQPVRVAVALPLYQIDGHQQVQLCQRLVELGAVGSGHHGVAAVDHHRPDLAGPGCRDLVGQFGECVGAGDQVAARRRLLCAGGVAMPDNLIAST